jgi:hypothetical protein
METVLRLIKDNNVKTFAEIGIFKGKFCREAWKRCQFKEYYMIDPYDASLFTVVRDGRAYINSRPRSSRYKLSQKKLDRLYRKMKAVKPFYATLIRLPSVEAAKKVEDNFFDMVFIDASHFYEDVKQDIISWLPKVKPGGILSGDDYHEKDFPEVIRAVNELLFNVIVEEYTWHVRKAL